MPVRFSASSAARFMACPASANLELAIPGWTPPETDEKKGAAAKGTKMHEVFAATAEMTAKEVLALAKALEYVGELRAKRRFKVLAEETVVAEWLDSKPQTTVDLCLYTQDELHVIDYKWGTIPVEVVGNEQLLFYAVSLGHLAPKAHGVTLHIVQPNADNIESWYADTNALADFMARARAAEQKISAGDTTFGPSDHCMFCPAYPHSRAEKGRPMCPVTLNMLYPSIVDEAAILGL